MKKLLIIFSFFITLFSFTACSLDEPDFGDQLYATDLAGKWRWSSSNEYSRIEFINLKYYFVTKTDGEVIYGTFRKTDDKQFTLSGFGVIDVSACDAAKLAFYLTLEGEDVQTSQSTYEYNADEDDISDNTYLISTLWEVTSGSGVDYFLFSTAGTFMTIDTSGTATSGSWFWESETNKTISYTINSVTNTMSVSYLTDSHATITYGGNQYTLEPYSGSF